MKTKIKKLGALALAVLMALSMLPSAVFSVFAEETVKYPPSSGDLTETISYTFDSATKTLTISGTGEIPDFDYSRGSENCSPFYGCKINNIVIGEGITFLGQFAFLELGEVESISLPSTLEDMQYRAFDGLNVIKNGFTVAEGNNSYSAQNGILFNKDKTVLIKYCDKDPFAYEDYTIPSNVKLIKIEAFCAGVTLNTLTLQGDGLELADYAIRDAKIKHLVINEGVEELNGHCSISNSGVFEDTEIHIPSSVISISDQSLFSHEALERITVDENNKYFVSVDGVLVEKKTGKLVAYPAGRKDTSYTTPAEVKILGFYSLDSNYLENIILSPSVEEIKSDSIHGNELKNIYFRCPFAKLPESVGSIFTRVNSVPKLENIFCFKDSAVQTGFLEDSNYADKVALLPDCAPHIADISRRVEPTCLDDGYDVCGVCGEKIANEALAAFGHNYESFVQEPTCISGGFTQHKCSHCGDSYQDSVTSKTTEHKLTNELTYDSATNEEVNHCKYETDGKVVYQGSWPETKHPYDNNANETYEIYFKGAKQIVVKFSRESCTEAWYDKVIFSYKDSVTGADGGSVEYGSSLSSLTKTFDTDKLTITFTSNNSGRQFYGFDFDEIYGVFEPCGKQERAPHTTHTEVVSSDTESTCKYPGNTTYKCSVCGKQRVVNKPLKEHNYVKTDETDGNCKLKGTITYTCSGCKDVKTEYKENYGNHYFVDGVCKYCKETHTIGEFKNFKLDANLGIVSWDAVDGAEDYGVFLFNPENESEGYKLVSGYITATSLDLKPFLTVGKSYRIVIIAYNDTYALSAEYPKDFDEGILFTYHNNGHTCGTKLTKATATKDGKIVKTCTVCKKTISTTTIYKASNIKLSTVNYTYNGKVKTPSVTVKDSKGKTLKKNTDYTVSYSKGRKSIGKYSVKITLKGNYSGSKTLYFNINPKGTKLSSVKAGKKQVTVKWKTQKSQTNGYQVQYSTSKKFKSAKTVTVNSNKSSSTTIKKLKGGKKYYVRVRTFKKVGKAKFYSAWSNSKNAKAKK